MNIRSRRLFNRLLLGVAGILSVVLWNGPATIVRAATPVPAGFNLVVLDNGVKVYRKNYSGGQPDFVTVVDLRAGGRLQSFTGWVIGDKVERRSLRTHWNESVAQDGPYRKTRVAISGTFFAVENPAAIAFGLKANWWRISYGYGLNEYPGLVRTLAFDTSFGSSSIQPYQRATFDGGIPDVVGGLDPTANKRRYEWIPRTFVGVRDDDHDGHSETVILYSSKLATQAWATNIVGAFGGGSKMMLDGGSTTGLIIDGVSYITPGRSMPHAFMVSAAR